MITAEEISKKLVPNHVAIIMDGNGRWAKQKGLPRTIGHKNGAYAIRKTIEAAVKIGVKHLTVYAFSTENWNRPKYEVKVLMSLFNNQLRKELENLIEHNVKLKFIGNVEQLPAVLKKTLKNALEKTKNNTLITITVALSYSAREELIYVAKNIAKKAINNEIAVSDIDENLINEHLQTAPLPDVDLMIRTSGEKRISNFLLWQIAYAELYFTDTLWPDFDENNLYEAVQAYQQRERRFGKTSEQIKCTDEQ